MDETPTNDDKIPSSEPIEDRIARLNVVAKSLGVDEATMRRIADEVDAEAQQSATWGTVEDRVTEIRRRLMKAAGSPQ